MNLVFHISEDGSEILLVPLGFSQKLKRHWEKVASMKIFASGKPAGLTRDLPLGIFPKLGLLYMNKGWINNVNFDEVDLNVAKLSTYEPLLHLSFLSLAVKYCTYFCWEASGGHQKFPQIKIMLFTDLLAFATCGVP